MEEDRIADRKNGHVLEDFDPNPFMFLTRRHSYRKSWIGGSTAGVTAVTTALSNPSTNLDVFTGKDGERRDTEDVSLDSNYDNNGEDYSNIANTEYLDLVGLERAGKEGKIMVHRGNQDANISQGWKVNSAVVLNGDNCGMDPMIIGDGFGANNSHGKSDLAVLERDVHGKYPNYEGRINEIQGNLEVNSRRLSNSFLENDNPLFSAPLDDSSLHRNVAVVGNDMGSDFQ